MSSGVQVCAAGPGLIQKLGRVLKEKAQGDIDRVFNGASKTRERLGVTCVSMPHLTVHFAVIASSGHIPIYVELSPPGLLLQVVEELFTYWSLEDADDTLEELEEALIVSHTNLLDC